MLWVDGGETFKKAHNFFLFIAFDQGQTCQIDVSNSTALSQIQFIACIDLLVLHEDIDVQANFSQMYQIDFALMDRYTILASYTIPNCTFEIIVSFDSLHVSFLFAFKRLIGLISRSISNMFLAECVEVLYDSFVDLQPLLYVENKFQCCNLYSAIIFNIHPKSI